MPIYEYQCRSCGHEFEVLQKINDAKLTDCPECNEASLQKKVSAAAFRLKGSGWYETDFKSGNKKNVAGDSGSGDGGEKSGEKAAKGGDGKDAAGGADGKKTDGGGKSNDGAKPAPAGKSKDSGSN